MKNLIPINVKVRGRLFLIEIFIVWLFSLSSFAQTFPTGFTRVSVATGISNPTVMAFAPDGRIFVARQNGTIRVIKNGSLLSTPFITLSVNSSGERGLIGIAFDPNFASNNFIYLYYTLPDASRNRISRFTANGDVVLAGSETVVLNLDALTSATNHNGGAMHFGPDGKLYVAIGENATRANAQNLDTYHGKILRINADGSVPSGNPFTGSAQRSRVWAYGLRNPYTIDFQPGTEKLFVNDVGEVTWEEINDATQGGKNFGWPTAEGMSSNTAFTNPVYTYQHGSGDGRGCAITGGVFFNPATSNYPVEYTGRYFYQDYCNNWINMLSISGSTVTRLPFATAVGTSALSIEVGNDGNLYYLERGSGALFKITYTNNAIPVIVSQPVNLSVSAGQSASFSVNATGAAPLTYRWQKNSVDIGNATSSIYTIPSAQTSDTGSYRVIVSNSSGSVTSTAALLTVTAFNAAPVATILTPANGTLYRGGDVITFSGNATDAEDGTLPAGAFSWSVEFHHDVHSHDGPPVASGVKSGSFTIPTSGELSSNVWYRLILTVADSKGLTASTFREIFPRKSTISLVTQPAGLTINLDGSPITTPSSIVGVEGIQRTIGINSPQSFGGKIYVFSNWLHGGSATQTISTPTNDITYTAVYTESNIAAGIYKLSAVHSGKYMDIAKVSQANGAKLQQWTSNSGNNQKFKIETVTGIYYRITAVHSNKALEVPGSSLTRGVQIRQQDYTGADNQLWSFSDAGNNTFYITNKNSQLVMDVLSNSQVDSASIAQWTRLAGNNQKWRLEFVSNITARNSIEDEVDVSFTNLSISPNPAYSDFQVGFYAPNDKDVEISIFDNTGTKLYSVEKPARKGKNIIHISIPGTISNGLYFIQVEHKRTKILIQK